MTKLLIAVGAFFTLSSFMWAFTGWTWWIDAPSDPGREFLLIIIHFWAVLGTIVYFIRCAFLGEKL